MPGPVPPLPSEEHECRRCAFAYTAVAVDTAIEVIAGVPARAKSAVLGVSDEQLRARPNEGTWSALEYLCHLRDVYAAYTIRLYRTRVEDVPVLEPMLNDLRAIRFRHNRSNPSAVLTEVADNVAGFLEEAARNNEATLRRTATRLPGEERTGRWLLRQAAHEGLHHLRDMERVLDQAAAVGPQSAASTAAHDARRDPIAWWAVTMDCREPERLATFWSKLLGSPILEPEPDRPGWRRLHPVPSGPRMNFQPIAEPKRGKVRLHLDILASDIDSAAERVLALGGTDTGAREVLPRGRIAVMQDPEGNEFCLLAPRAS